MAEKVHEMGITSILLSSPIVLNTTPFGKLEVLSRGNQNKYAFKIKLMNNRK